MSRKDERTAPFTPLGRFAEKIIPSFLRPGYQRRGNIRSLARSIRGESSVDLKNLKDAYTTAQAFPWDNDERYF